MERYTIQTKAQDHINAYLEYRMIVGSKPNDPLLPEAEYGKLRKEFYAKKGPIILTHGQPKTKKLLDKNFDPNSEPLIQGFHLEDLKKQKSSLASSSTTKAFVEENKLVNLCNQELTLSQLRNQYPSSTTNFSKRKPVVSRVVVTKKNKV